MIKSKNKTSSEVTRKDQKKKTKQPIVLEPSLPSPISQELLSDQSRVQLKSYHDAAEPYKYIVLSPLCNNERMRLVHEEAKNNMTATFKETDLFKVYQTGDLATIDSSDPVKQKQYRHLLSLRDSIYSKDFRDFISQVMGCDDLTDRVDCSANAYTQGCHLLCHDDVIGTRRISYIIYLTDPDDPWEESEGGALELYPLDRLASSRAVVSTGQQQGIPTPAPTKLILPRFNTMALFKVQPGRSYHSVQEVVVEELKYFF